MLGESRLFKAVFALNMATRGSRFGPKVARFAYWLWDSTWDTFFALRSLIRGYVAEFELIGKPVLMDLRDRSITRALYVFHEYEPLQTYLLEGLLKPGMTFIDIGANIGYYSLIAAMAVGETGRVIAFEPYPGNVEIFIRNIALNNLHNIQIETKAISDRKDEMKLYLSSINAGDHRLYDGEDDDFYNLGRIRKRIYVETVTLDEYINNAGVKVDVIKLDIQGAEYDALQGMKHTLTANRDVVVMSEYWPHGLERCGADPIAFLSEFDALGFHIFRTSSQGGFIRLTQEAAHASVSGVDSLTLFFSRGELI